MHRMFRTMVAAAAAIGATLWIGVPAAQAASIGGPFELVDHTGQTVTEESFDDRYLLVYFGYAYCPDICPTELLIMGQAVDELGELGDEVQPLFVTVDPARDTVEYLADYVPSFHPRLVGLTGSDEQIHVLRPGPTASTTGSTSRTMTVPIWSTTPRTSTSWTPTATI